VNFFLFLLLRENGSSKATKNERKKGRGTKAHIFIYL